MRIDLSPFKLWCDMRFTRLLPRFRVGLGEVSVVRVTRTERPGGRASFHYDLLGWASANDEDAVEVKWEPGTDPDAWSEALDYEYAVTSEAVDVSEDPGTYVPSQWRLTRLLLQTHEEAAARVLVKAAILSGTLQ